VEGKALTFRINEHKLNKTSREKLLAAVVKELKHRIRLGNKKGSPLTEKQMIDGFTDQYKGQFGKIYAKIGVSLKDLIKTGRKVLAGEYDEKPFVREDAKIGRNDKCPCGSGLKYKKCCGR
jgi:hypothetical protein